MRALMDACRVAGMEAPELQAWQEGVMQALGEVCDIKSAF